MIAAAGDIACDPGDANFNGGLGTSTFCHQQSTSDILAGGGLNAVLPLGDEQYECGSASEFAASYGPTWGRVKTITYPVPGNHEYQTSSSATNDCDASGHASGYFGFFGAAAGDPSKGYYSYDIGGWHLIALNTNLECGSVACAAGSAQEQWLKADLAAHPTQCTLAYWHHPLFSSKTTSPASTAFWQDLYAAGADLVLNGHVHNYERFAPQDPSGNSDPSGIREFIVGTGGRSLESFATTAPNSLVRNNSTFGVLELTLHPGSYDWKFVPEAGKTFTDTGSGTCHHAAADTSPPTAPANLTATGSSGSASVSWSPSTDNVGVATYDVYRSMTSGFVPTSGTLLTRVSGTSYVDSGLSAGTYYYVVEAEDAASNVSPPSSQASATVTAATTTPPAFVATIATRAVTDDASNSLALTVGAAGVASGDTVVISAGKGNDQQAIASVSDSRGNTYTVDRNVHGQAGSGIGIGVASGRIATALAAGDTITVTYEGTTGYTNRFAAAYDFSGLAGADVTATATGYGTQLSSGTATTTQGGDLSFALFDVQPPSAGFVAGSGYQALASVTGGIVGQVLQPEWAVAGAAGPVQPTATLGSLASWQGVLVTYRAAAGAPPPPPPSPPANTAPPTISGTARSGSTLTATAGTWTGTTPLAYAYDWQRCATGSPCAHVGTSSTYALTDADVGATIQVAVTASNSAGSATATSAPTPAVAVAPPPSAAGFVGTVATRALTDDASNTLALTVGAAGVAAGDTVVVVASKGQDQAAVASLSDSRGNAYTVDKNVHGASGSGFGMGIGSSRLATALQPGDTITVTFEGATGYTNRFAAAYDFSGLAGADVTATTSGYGTQLASGSATPSQSGDLLLGIFLLQSTSPAFTPSGGAQALTGVAGAVVGQTLQPEWAMAGASGAQQTTATLGSLASWQSALVAYRTGGGTGGTPPANTALPAISGNATDGSTLTASTGTWTGTAPISYTYRWQRCAPSCVDVGTGATYTLVSADVGQSIHVVVNGTNAYGSATATSASVVTAAARPANTAAPTISGAARAGSTLTASTGTWAGTTPLTYSYAWQRCDVNGNACGATGVTTATYTVAAADVGSTLRVVVTASNSAGSVSATSAATAVVAAAATGPRYVKDVASASVTDSNDNQLVLTAPAGGVAAGDSIVVVASKGVDQNGIASVTDQRGNVYTVDRNAYGTVNGGLALGIASAYVTTALSAGDRITITFEGATAYSNRWGIAYEFGGLASGAASDVSAVSDGYSTSPTVGPTAASTQTSELVFGAFDMQATGSGFAAGTGFQALTPAPSVVLGQTLVPEFAIVSTAGQRQATVSFPSPVSYVGAVVSYRSSP